MRGRIRLARFFSRSVPTLNFNVKLSGSQERYPTVSPDIRPPIKTRIIDTIPYIIFWVVDTDFTDGSSDRSGGDER